MERKSCIWGKMMYGKTQLLDSTPSLKAPALGKPSGWLLAAPARCAVPCQRTQGDLGQHGGTWPSWYGDRAAAARGGPGSGYELPQLLHFPAWALFVPHLITA